jgi:hypothetical protein
MTDDVSAAVACPPHHWQVTLLPDEGGLIDHYRCQRCGVEKDVVRSVPTRWTPRRPPGRPRRAAE